MWELETLNKRYFRSHASLDFSSIRTGIKSIDYLHLISTQLDSGMMMISDLGFSKEILIKFFSQLATTCFNLYKCSDIKSLVINLGNFFVQYFPAKYIDLIVGWFLNALDNTREFLGFAAMAQNGTTDVDKEKTLFARIQNFITTIFDTTSDERLTQFGEFFVKLTTLWNSLEKGISFESLDLKTLSEQWTVFSEVGKTSADIFGYINEAYVFVVLHWAIDKRRLDTLIFG